MTSPVAVVAATTAKLWRRELAGTLGVRERTAVGGLIAFSIAMLGFSALLAALLAQFLGSVSGAALADQRPLLRLVLAGLLLGSVIYQLVICATLPGRDRLHNVLAVLPVPSTAGSIGVHLPAIGLGFAVSVVIGFPTLAMIGQLADGTPISLPAALAFLWVVALAATGVPAVFFTVRELVHRRFALPAAYGLAIAAGATVIIGIAVAAMDLVPRAAVAGGDAWSLLLPTRALAEILQPGSSDGARLTIAWSAAALWSAAATALLARVVLRYRPVEARPVASPTLRIGRRGGIWRTRFMLELVQLTRLPQAIVATLLLVLAAIALPLLYLLPGAPTAIDQVASLPVVVAFALGAYSYGSTRRAHWVASLATRPGGWAAPKALACLVLPSLLSAPYLAGMALAGVPAPRLVDIVSLGISMWVAAQVAGLLVPFADDQPLSATITSAVTAGTWALSVFGVRWLLAQAGLDSPLLGAAIVVAVLGAVVAVASRGVRERMTADA